MGCPFRSAPAPANTSRASSTPRPAPPAPSNSPPVRRRPTPRPPPPPERIINQTPRALPPRSGATNWNGPRPDYGGPSHPAGAFAVHFESCGGTNVIRYNQLDSDADHYFEAVLSAAENFSDGGRFPHDS